MDIRRFPAWSFLGTLTLVSLSAGHARADDADFASKAMSGGMMEVELGRLAQAKAMDPDVKSFGRRMVEDHGKAGDRLREVVSGAGMTVPRKMSAEHRATVAELSDLKGAAFDRRYVELMVEDHEKDVAEFRQQTKTGDSAVDRWARETLPTLEHHLAMAKEMARSRDGTRGGH